MDHSCGMVGKANMMKDGQFFRTVEQNCWDPATRVKEMDRDGITVQARILDVIIENRDLKIGLYDYNWTPISIILGSRRCPPCP